LNSLQRSGARISYGSDWPVTSQVPLQALAVPVHRQSPDGYPKEGWSKQEAITIEESMTFYTANVAFQLFKEERDGKLGLGKRADFIVLNQSPLEVDPHKVSSIKILSVYKDGVPQKSAS
jgi:predicted amidohydrolase YtcJ